VVLRACSCDLVWGGEGDDLLAYQVVPNFRVRTIPVLGPIPAVFGMAAAAYVLTELARQPIVSEPIYSLRMNQYQTLYDRLVTRAEERWGAPCLCPVTRACLFLSLQDRSCGVLSCLRIRLRGAFLHVARIEREVADTARSETGLRTGANELHADAVDVMYVVKDLFGGTSARALPQPGKGLWRTTHNLGARPRLTHRCLGR
jgi:hypothetical protein